jgi:ribosome-binding protein aMBF1 (putative translation factor)
MLAGMEKKPAGRRPKKRAGNRGRTPAQQAAYEEYRETRFPEVALRREVVAARVRAGLSQAELAERMGTAQPAIARLESGGGLPSFTTLKKLARATGSKLVVRFEVI